MRARFGPVRGCLYRAGLLGATVAGVRGLEWVQSRTPVVLNPTRVQSLVRAPELSWLLCLPVAAALWIGWFLFAEAVRREPEAAPAPVDGGEPVRLVFRFVTRGENTDALRRSIEALRASVASYPHPLREPLVQIVTDRPTGLAGGADEVVVPASFVPPRGSRYKARALTLLQSFRPPDPADWCVYLDEESRVGRSFLAGALEFVDRALREAGRGGPAPIGQGAILYDGGHWLFRGADGLRTADDLGRFRLQYALGIPCFGVHGSFLIVRGVDEGDLSFDVGERGSLTEDAAWALRAWAAGRPFRWVRGYLHEQPPQTVGDFRRQRGRWISGLRRVCADRGLPLRTRVVLGAAVGLWQLSFVPLAVAVLAVLARQGPDPWLRGPADFALTTFVLAYAQGAATRAAHGFRTGDRERSLRARLLRPARVAAATTLCVPFIWYVTMEALGVLKALTPVRRFHVIAKPDLTPVLSTAGGVP
jgi:beta-1,4-mannosyltransferase